MRRFSLLMCLLAFGCGPDKDGDGFAPEDGDCDDENPAINPEASDVVGDSIDQNCDGIDGLDVDGEGCVRKGQ